MFEWLKKWWRHQFVSDNSPKVVSEIKNYTIRNEFSDSRAYRSGKIHFADAYYYTVDKDWVLGPWYNYYRKVLKGLNIQGWSEDFDCDNFAGLYKEIVQVCHKVTNVDKGGVAVGMVWYAQDVGGAHAINVVFVDNDMVFIEPQNGRIICLSEKELQSIWFVLF